MKTTNTKRPSRNREKLITTTVELMNQQGCNVGTAQIAEHCGISPGNLYYHFRNREGILREIFVRIKSDLHAVLHTRDAEVIDAARLAGFYTGGAQVLWRYRFLFASATEFIYRDPSLAYEYRNFTEHSIEQMEVIIKAVTSAHPGRVAASAAHIRSIAENKWVLWIAWPRYAELRAGEAGVGPSDMAQGLEQIFSLLAPYLESGYAERTAVAVHRYVEALQRAL